MLAAVTEAPVRPAIAVTFDLGRDYGTTSMASVFRDFDAVMKALPDPWFWVDLLTSKPGFSTPNSDWGCPPTDL
jgi:hypothetical protein